MNYLGVWTVDYSETEKLVQLANVLERGRRVACDIGGADPERYTVILQPLKPLQ